MKRVGLYARVSTKNNGQDPETQLIALREYAGHRGMTITDEYVDVGISGAKDRRPELDRMMTDARRRKFDVVLVARFDRFARSTKHLVFALEEFNALGIDFVSLNESVDTSTPMGKMVFTVIGAVAELERSLIRERVMMGLERAKRNGKALGRPRRIVDREAVQSMKDRGNSTRVIAKHFGVSKDTVRNILRTILLTRKS
jgi:DNA invertase Pin-like site-specific DNA recombinase